VELLDETKQKELHEDWMYGRSLTSGEEGGFPYDCVYIFPTCSKPPSDFLAVFGMMSTANLTTLPRKRGALVLAKGTMGRSAGHGVHSAI
jgi:myosin-7